MVNATLSKWASALRAVAIGLCCLPLLASAQVSIDELTQQNLAELYSLNALLTNGDAVRFGIWDFNLGDYVDVELDNLGNAESARLRQSITVASIPYDWEFPIRDTDDRLILGVGVSYLAQEQDVKLVANQADSTNDKVSQDIFTLSGRAHWRHQFRDDITIKLGSGLHWMRYRNDTDFRTDASRALKPQLDGLLTNIEVDALIAEPSAEFSFQRNFRGVDWHFFTDYHYLRGQTISPDREAHDTSPEAWYWSNGVRILNPVFSRALPGQNIWVRAARVDVGGDMGDQLGSNHYYEAGIAWLLKTGDWIPLVDNVAIGVNFNVGSVLRGGSLFLTFNED